MATQDRIAPSLGWFKAETDLSTTGQWLLAELNATKGEVDLCDNAGDFPIGIIQNNPKAGEAVELGTAAGSVYKLTVDGNAGAIAIGDTLGTDAAGKGVKKSADAAWYCCIALQASTAAGDIIPVLWVGLQQRAS